jgi:hypothetical protein
MNGCIGRQLTIFAILVIATSATVRAADDPQSQPIARTTTSQDKAAQAQRLAIQAAALAKQAATLADESHAELSATAAGNANSPVSDSQRLESQASIEVFVSDDAGDAKAARESYGRRDRQFARGAQLRSESDKSPPATPDRITTGSTSSRKSPNNDDARLAVRTFTDREVLTANDLEPVQQTHAPNHESNSGQDGYNVGGYDERSSCDDNCCNTCNSRCDVGCCDAPCLFWTGGVEATFLKPNFKDSHATMEVTDTASERDYFCSTDDNDVDSLYVAPRIWLGVEGCCWGADVKYWQMRAQNGGADASLNGDGLWSGPGCGVPDIGRFSCNGLDLYTLDLEVSRRFCLRDEWMQLSMGVRHAEIRHDSSIVANSDLGDTNLIAYARDDSFTQGTGLVFGLYGRRPVYPCSCINWYYNLHYSVLWGPTTTAAETAAQIVVNDPGSAGSTNLASTRVDSTLLIGEVQLGLEWDYALKCLPANAFFRAGIEFQDWQGGPGSSSANSFAGTSTTVNNVVTNMTQATANANSGEPRLDLFGFTLGTGLTW